MNPITKAIDEIKFRIPRRILEQVFIVRTDQWRQNLQNIDDNILSTVVKPRVLVDCDLCGGTETFIYLDGIPYERMNDFTSIYRIPKDKTQGRSILSVLNITFADPTKVSSYGIAAGQQNTTMMQAGQAVMDAMGALPVTSTHRVQLIAENTVMVRDTVILPPNVYLRCILENDENMSHLQLRSYRQFCKLVEYAVKSYIYNEYIIEMDIGELYGGQQLGKFKEIIESYSDAEDNYQDYLRNVMQKVQLMNDNESYTRLLRTMLGSYR